MYALKVERHFDNNAYQGSLYCISESESESTSNNESIRYNDQPELENFGESNEQLEHQITTLAGQINAANYSFLKLIAEFDRRQAWSGYGLRSCAHWLNWKCGISMNPAREKVRTARALEGLPGINAAFQKGELSFSKVRAMTRIATEENESYLLDIAEYGTVHHVEVLVKASRTVSRIADKAEDFNAADLGLSEEQQLKRQEQQQDDLQKESRSVSCYQDDDGMWIINAKLPAEEGGIIAKALKELGDRLADSNIDTAKETPQNSEKSVSAETFSLDKKEEKLTFSQRRADALIAMTEHYLASANSSSPIDSITSLKGAERCQLIMHVRAGSLNQGAGTDLEADLGISLDGRWLIPNAARRLACDAGLLVVEEDAVGNVLNIGRRSRIIPPAMSRALVIRDGGCQFPGCCETRYVEGHHIKHWADGGDTKLDNLVTLCRYHHRELHKGSFFLSLKPNTQQAAASKPQRFAERLCFSKVDRYFDAPFNRSANSKNDKRVIAANPAKFTCACCDSTELGKTIPRLIYNAIDERTAVTKWAGESMDLGMAIDGLLSVDKQSINFKRS
jgi:hypothetical protein